MSQTVQSPSPYVPLRRFRSSWWAVPLILVAGSLFVGLGARLEVPMVPVPVSMQTYAVVVLGALAGWQLGAGVVVGYLAAAALGAPVLAGGGSGIDHLMGNTAGYLVGFALSAAYVGYLAERGWTNRGLLRSLLAMMIGHAIILTLGVIWLGTRIGWLESLEHGLLPFLIGAVAKSLLAAGSIELLRRL